MVLALTLCFSLQSIPEPHLTNVNQLTFGGQNAEAYWNADCTRLTWQARVEGYPAEQIFSMNGDGSDRRLVSTGKGRCTCSYYSPDGNWIYFSSTHARNEGAQAPVDMSKGYVWMINPEYALYKVAANDPDAKPKPVVDWPGYYVAETTIAPDSSFMVWTSDRSGDLEIYRSDLKGKNIVRLTNQVGYDGGPFVSWDSKKIVFRRDSSMTAQQELDYKTLLKNHYIRPSRLEIWIMDADGSHKHQVTHLNCASFAPFLHPDGKRIVFSSNYGDPKGREFDIFMINVDGTGLRRITRTPEFDGFPMFTRDGKRLVFASNRNGKVRGETNVFTADWVE
jgi:Tol biopolymer transport system component